MKCLGIFLFFYISWSETLGISSNSEHSKNWNSSIFDGLIKYLKDDSKLHQVAFILDDSLMDPLMISLMTTVNLHFPSFSIDYSDIRQNNLTESHVKLLTRSRSTTLFIFQLLINSTTIKEIEKFLFTHSLLIGSSMPKCLVVNPLPLNNGVIKEVLDNYWTEEYLDISLLTYSQHTRVLQIEQSSPMGPILSQMNPFFNNYSSHPVSSKTQWFPNKLIDLNGYSLNFSCQPANDTSQVEYNSGLEFLNILQKAMNFKSNLKQLVFPDGKIWRERNKQERTNFFDVFIKQYSEISPQIWLNVGTFYHTHSEEGRNLLILRLSNARAVIPREAKVTKVIQVSSQFWFMILATISMICVIRLLVFLLKFRTTTWQTLNISQIIIGAAASEEPDNLSERIIFGSLLIASVFYNGYFYSIILDIHFQSSPEITNLSELIKSHLTPMMERTLPTYLSEISNTDVQQWLNRSTEFSRGESEYCLKLLDNFRNISCVLDDAAYHVNNYQAKNGLINVKILPDVMGNSYRTFTTRLYSPYISRFNEIILKASSFGLLREFYGDTPSLRSSPKEPEFITKEKLLPVLLCVLIGGYSLSIIAFLLEVITKKLKEFFYKPKLRFVH